MHNNSSACLIVNGKLMSAAQEERFTEFKHTCCFPVNAIKFCLESSNVNIRDMDYITTNFNIKYNQINKNYFFIEKFF